MKQLLKQDNPKYKIDESRKVFIYKNLHKGCWSVRQDGLVKMHTDSVALYHASFRVGEKGRERVLQEKRKNVHAGISGYLDTAPEWETRHPRTKKVSYNPYKNTSFVYEDGKPCFWSSTVKLSEREVRAVPCIEGANFL